MPTSAKRKTPATGSSTPSKPPAKKASTGASSAKKPNGNILSFFKKVDGPPPPIKRTNGDLRDFGFGKGRRPGAVLVKGAGPNGADLFYVDGDDEDGELYSVNGDEQVEESRETGDEEMDDLFGPLGTQEQKEVLEKELDVEDGEGLDSIEVEKVCTPPPPDPLEETTDDITREEAPSTVPIEEEDACPFTFEEAEEEPPTNGDNHELKDASPVLKTPETLAPQLPELEPQPQPASEPWVPESLLDDDEFIEDEGMENFDDEQDSRWKAAEEDDIEDDDEEVGEEKINRRYMEQAELDEMAFLESLGPVEEEEETGPKKPSVSCPMCNADLGSYTEDFVSRHVNGCLDGKPVPLPPQEPPPVATTKPIAGAAHPPRPAQKNPFATPSGAATSAFSKIMTANAEDRAWKAAADDEVKSRGKRSFQRTCPFYKIIPNFSVAVDAFRYGAVENTAAYFLSHFHSDHYIGLSSSWTHGPIYCSQVTANLCRRQLRVDPQYLVELEYEKRTEIPGTDGATVTMIDANHCPGSSLFLLEKIIPSPRGGRLQRILHCGDFRACAKHLRHPLLSTVKKNKIDVCYLDTTYLNPKYAFPPQREVIDACKELCVSLDRDVEDGKETVYGAGRVGAGIERFTVATGSTNGTESAENQAEQAAVPHIKTKGKLLVVVGTYSIGKERICMGIAEALGSKIYAPKNKQRICAALEDAELNSRLTSDPHAAQVHMTPLMEIRPETLKEYLATFKSRFTKVVGFRPSGWNYRPPGGRLVDNPAVATVLKSQAWRSRYGVEQMAPQRGSTADVKCFGVPYSEHSSFRELTTFCCGLDIIRIIPTVNVGSAKSREKMKFWFEKWAAEKKKTGFFKLEEGQDVL